MAHGRLLILDDDETVGNILLMSAQALGFEARLCIEAEAFHDALSRWTPTHLMIDLTLPDTTGEQVLRRVAAAGCQARIIVCSGADKRELDTAVLQAKELGLPTAGALSKPFRLGELQRLLAG